MISVERNFEVNNFKQRLINMPEAYKIGFEVLSFGFQKFSWCKESIKRDKIFHKICL